MYHGRIISLYFLSWTFGFPYGYRLLLFWVWVLFRSCCCCWFLVGVSVCVSVCSFVLCVLLSLSWTFEFPHRWFYYCLSFFSSLKKEKRKQDFVHFSSPRYNRTGLLGLKHQFTYFYLHSFFCLFQGGRKPEVNRTDMMRLSLVLVGLLVIALCHALPTKSLSRQKRGFRVNSASRVAHGYGKRQFNTWDDITLKSPSSKWVAFNHSALLGVFLVCDVLTFAC